MKNKTKVYGYLLIVVLIALTFISCATQKGFEGKASIYGLVFTESGKAVPGYSIQINGKQKALTDIQGIFIIHDLKSGIYDISGQKDGFSDVSEKIDIYDRKKLIIFNVTEEF